MAHSSWEKTIQKAHEALSEEYRQFLQHDNRYFPSKELYLNAFSSLPKENLKYILFGQDPYPRVQSAIGYAFIDGGVENIFARNGLSKEVNRATSLRNFIKMALVARGDLRQSDTSQEAIAGIDKQPLIQTILQLKDNFEKNGVLLLNTALIFTDKRESNSHIRSWRPFLETLLQELIDLRPTLILFGAHAQALKKLQCIESFPTVSMEHPYNHTFISNQTVLDLFAPMDLLAK